MPYNTSREELESDALRSCTLTGKTMAVYAIAMFSITDRVVYGRYQAQFMGVMNRYKGTVLAADEHPVVVEGDWDRDKVVMLSFGSEADFREFMDSPEYQGISKDRQAGTSGFVLLVRGIPERK
jgi:uncharacterized protein (DUF1330 family)